MKTYIGRSILMALFIISSFAAPAQIVVRVRPAAPFIGGRPLAPSARHVWIDGGWAYRGNAYAWTDGYWAMPRPGMIWIAGNWRHRRGGWVWAPGYWRRRF